MPEPGPSDDDVFAQLMATVAHPHWPLLLPITLVVPRAPDVALDRSPAPSLAAVAPPASAAGATHRWRHESRHLARCEACGTRRAAIASRHGDTSWFYQADETARSTRDEPPCRAVQRHEPARRARTR